MALKAATYDPATAVTLKLSTLLGYSRKDWFEIEFVADADNTGSIFMGPSTLDETGANATMELKPGYSKRWGPYNAGGGFVLDPELLYLAGATEGDKCYVNGITAHGRRIPLQGFGEVTDA